MRLLEAAKQPIPVQVRDCDAGDYWVNEILIGALVDTTLAFKDTNGVGWKQCRVEIKS